MWKWSAIWQNTIFRRLVLTFLLVILPIYVIGINIYNWGVRAIDQGITASMTSQVSFYMDKLGSEIRRIKQQQEVCMLDENLTQLVYLSNTLSDYDKSKTILRMKYQLNAIRNSSNYIKDVKVYLSGLKYTISGYSGVNFYDDMNQDILNSAFVSRSSPITYWKGSFYLIDSYNSTYQNKVLYWIEIPLDSSVFVNDLNQFNTFKDSISMIYCPAADAVLSSGAEVAGKDLQNSLRNQLESSKSGTYSVEFNHKRYNGYYYVSDYLGITLARYVPEGIVLSPVKNYQVWLWVFLSMSFLIIVLFSVSIYNSIHKPLTILLNSFEKVEGGNLAVSIEHRHKDEFKHLYHSFNRMVENLRSLIDQAYKQKILMQHAELKQLQAQVKPHFLYNSFFTLHNMARAGDYDTVQSFLKQLGEYYKYIARNVEDEVPLSKEAEYARIYTNIQALRFENRLTVEFDEVPERFRGIIVPRFLIQPIIENSFKYALEGKAGKGILRVNFAESNGCLEISVEDNGKGMGSQELQSLRGALEGAEATEEGTGIVNIHRRLQLKFGGFSGLVLTDSELGGCKIIIRIELSEGQNV